MYAPQPMPSRTIACSTPFGITEVGTRHAISGSSWLRRVLNAFRHHRGRHFRKEPGAGIGVSVLNAFRHHRGRHDVHDAWHRRGSSRAQRLSASQRSARRGGELLRVAGRVCSTPFGITEVGTLALAVRRRPLNRVLNAFRHHRGRHDCRSSSAAGTRRCSTPFGITEVGTPARRPAIVR